MTRVPLLPFLTVPQAPSPLLKEINPGLRWSCCPDNLKAHQAFIEAGCCWSGQLCKAEGHAGRVEGYWNPRGAGEVQAGREEGLGSRNRKGRRRRETPGYCRCCGFLYTRCGRLGTTPSPTRREEWVTEEEAPLRRWPRSIQPERAETTFFLPPFSPSFLGGFPMFVLSPLKLCSFEFSHLSSRVWWGFVKSWGEETARGKERQSGKEHRLQSPPVRLCCGWKPHSW